MRSWGMASQSLSFAGRTLYLSQDPSKIRRQLEGEELSLEECLPLRDQISTDEITPAWVCYYFDARLGDFPYLGLKCDGEFPIGEHGVRNGGFEISVAGKRRGKGSSREASPYAELCAGIRLILAESFERIYLQNAQNLGLYASTDFGLLERIREGESIPVEAFTQGLDPITAEIVRRGGLFPFNRARMAGEVHVDVPCCAPRPMTLAEKILARHAVVDAAAGTVGLAFVKPGDGLFVKTDWRFSHEYVTPMAASFLEKALPDAELRNPEGVLAFRDHLTFLDQSMEAEKRQAGLLEVAKRLKTAQEAFCAQHGIRLHGEGTDGSEGICHSLMSERYALPGQVIVGTDSHTSQSGALGCLAFGVGTTDIANAWITGDVRVTVPPTIRVNLKGSLPWGVSAKDIMLEILRQPFVREGGAIGHVIEYAGETLGDLSVDERATLTNMAAEIGGFSGLVSPDFLTLQFLEERRGVSISIEEWMCSDPDAQFDRVLDIDCSKVQPMVARPGDPGQGVPILELDAPVPIDLAYGGSCTGGKREDIQRMAEVALWASERGLVLPPQVHFFIQMGSEDVRRFAESQGWLKLFEGIGARILGPGCGACINAGPGVSHAASQVTISAINRNFPGRSGPGQVWLASPATVAASAFAGRILSFEQLQDQDRQHRISR